MAAISHPEDEFCQPGQGGLDPALCRELAELDRADGRASQPSSIDQEVNSRGWLETAKLYIRIGIGHILPGGLDHILFVVALFLTSPRLRPLVIQISAFTLAHTVTLALAAKGIISPPSWFVEPFIAATIAFVAIENLIRPQMPPWRPLVVFGFGLIHGLGFAGFFGELGLPEGQFWSALIGFNIGVEIGQLVCILVIAIVAALFRSALSRRNKSHWYRIGFTQPCSA